MNPRKMQQMMKQMGIDVEEIDAERVVIETADGDLVFEGPQVTKMDAQGQETYQIVGSPDEVADAGVDGAVDATAVEGETVDENADDGGIPDGDIEIVAQRAGVPQSEALSALEDADGDLAAAVAALE